MTRHQMTVGDHMAAVGGGCDVCATYLDRETEWAAGQVGRENGARIRDRVAGRLAKRAHEEMGEGWDEAAETADEDDAE